jgi:uncharacterized protein (TIGR02594 family)
MKKLTPSVFVLLSIFAIGSIASTNAYAEPSSSESASVEKVKKKVVKKKQHRKKKVIDKQLSVAELKTQCYSNYSLGTDLSAAAFFACDNIGLPSSKFETPVTKAAAKAENSWFGSSSAPKIINEASRLEGLNARKDKEEIKSYLKAGNSHQTPVDPTRTPWCAAFANAVLRRTGYEGTDSLMARSFLSYGIKTKDPKEGDIVVLKRGKSKITGHVGFFNGYEWEGDQLYVKVLGGNQNKSVNVAYFPVNYVLGYRRPV